MTTPSGHCERARQWASLHLDGELSELEHALLDAHLERCVSCRAFADGLRGLATAMRAVPAELPAHPVQVRRLRSSRSLRILQASAAVAVVATAGLGAMVVDVFHTSTEASSAPRIEHVSAIGDESPSTASELRRAYALAVRHVTVHVLFP